MIREMEPWAAAVLLSAGMVGAWFAGWRWARWEKARGRAAPEGEHDTERQRGDDPNRGYNDGDEYAAP